jgi:multiple sugar transport system substrate-binding protein
VTIDYFHALAFASDTVRDLISRFEKANPNITVKEKTSPPDYRELAQQVQAALAAGEPPTVAMVGYDTLRYAAASLPHLRIDEAAGRDAEGGGEWLSKNFAPNVLDLGRVDGALHFMPYSISTPVLFYNEKAFEDAGLQSPPRTWSELREYARRLTEETDLLGTTISADLWGMQAVIESNGGRILADSGGELRCQVDGPEAIEATSFVVDMVLEDRTASYDRDLTGVENFASGKLGMVVGSNANTGLIREGAGFPFGAAPFPTFGDKPRRLPAGGNTLGIFAKDEDQQAAGWALIKYLLSPEALTMWDKDVGYLPPRRELAEDPRYLKPVYEDDPAARVGQEQISDLVPWASFPGESGLEAAQELSDAFQRSFAGEKVVATALAEAARRINELIQ